LASAGFDLVRDASENDIDPDTVPVDDGAPAGANRGKDGTWGLWVRQAVVALRLNLTLSDTQYEAIAKAFPPYMVLARIFARVSTPGRTSTN